MAKYTKQEFVKMMGMELKNIYPYIKREQLVEKNGYIDTDHPTNKSFIEKRAAKVDIPTEINSPYSPKQAQITPENNDHKTTESNYKKLLIEKKHVEIAKGKKETERIDLDIAKKRGQVVPVSSVKALIKGLNQNHLVYTKNAMESFLTEIAHKHNLSGEELAGMRTTLVKTLNKTMESSVEATILNLDSIIDDYSDQVGAGQKRA